MFVRRKIFYTFLVVLLILSLLSGCTKAGSQPISEPTVKPTGEPIKKSGFFLDTICDITVYDNVSEEVLDKGFSVLQEIDDKMSATKATSEIMAINNASGKSSVKVSDDTLYVISKGIQYGETTEGKFDISVGPLVKLWGINTDHARIPSKDEIKSTLQQVGYKNVVINEAKNEVMLKLEGMSLDLGGIAKGYAGDAVADVLKNNGVKHAIINLGGSIVVIGAKPNGNEWNIGIQDPAEPRGEYLGILSVSNKAIATSGIYERFFIENGVRYHHIMDTSTGYPVDNSLASVSIISDKSIDGDPLAKAFTMGLEDGMKFIEKQQGVEAIFVTKDSKVYITPGLKNTFNVTNSSYTLMN